MREFLECDPSRTMPVAWEDTVHRLTRTCAICIRFGTPLTCLIVSPYLDSLGLRDNLSNDALTAFALILLLSMGDSMFFPQTEFNTHWIEEEVVMDIGIIDLLSPFYKYK